VAQQRAVLLAGQRPVNQPLLGSDGHAVTDRHIQRLGLHRLGHSELSPGQGPIPAAVVQVDKQRGSSDRPWADCRSSSPAALGRERADARCRSATRARPAEGTMARGFRPARMPPAFADILKRDVGPQRQRAQYSKVADRCPERHPRAVRTDRDVPARCDVERGYPRSVPVAVPGSQYHHR